MVSPGFDSPERSESQRTEQIRDRHRQRSDLLRSHRLPDYGGSRPEAKSDRLDTPSRRSKPLSRSLRSEQADADGVVSVGEPEERVGLSKPLGDCDGL